MITEQQFIDVCKQVEDPELQIDIWTLGLIYDHKMNDDSLWVKMTFTSPFCPYGPALVNELKSRLHDAGTPQVEIEITFDPAWQPSEELKEMMGM